ncbi:MAG: hypothetical protein MUF71_02560 [Candidatus Kapabacteria bacterium]|nr:hypothetical protein [Candidatus Kapabacteria bacterium]
MKFSKILGFAALLVVLVLQSCDPNAGGEKFGYKAGDYSVYETVAIDSAGRQQGTPTRSTTTVLRTNVSVGGQSDAAELVDSTFGAGGPTVTRTFYRVSNDEVFYYLDTAGIGAVVGALGMGATAPRLTGFTPRWVKSAELKDAAGTMDFPEISFSVSTEQPPLGTVMVTAKIVGRNQGKTAVMINSSTTHQTHRQSQTVTASSTIPLVGNISIPVTTDTYFGIPSTGAPRTIVRTESKATSINIPILGPLALPGSRRTLVSFTPGK